MSRVWGVIEESSNVELLACLAISDEDAVDAPSAEWLGRSSARGKIKGSGLWNVNHVEEIPGSDWLSVLERWIGEQRRS